MLEKPHISDYRYNDLNADALRREYERDLMLYEQTRALQKIAKTSDFSIDIDKLTMYDVKFEGNRSEQEIKYEKYCNLLKQKDEIRSYISTVKNNDIVPVLIGILLVLLEICNIPVPIIPHWAAMLLIVSIPLLVKAYYEHKLHILNNLYKDICKQIRKLQAESRKVKKRIGSL